MRLVRGSAGVARMGHKPDENWEKLWEARAIASCESFLDNRRRLSGAKKNNQIESEGNHRYRLSFVFFFGSAIKVWFKVVELSVRQFFAIRRLYGSLALCHHRAKLTRLDLIFASAHHRCTHQKLRGEMIQFAWLRGISQANPENVNNRVCFAHEKRMFSASDHLTLSNAFPFLRYVVGTHPVHRSLSGCLFVNLFGGLFRQRCLIEKETRRDILKLNMIRSRPARDEDGGRWNADRPTKHNEKDLEKKPR